MSDHIASSVLDIPSTVRIIRFVVDMLKSMLVVWELGEERATEETESPRDGHFRHDSLMVRVTRPTSPLENIITTMKS